MNALTKVLRSAGKPLALTVGLMAAGTAASLPLLARHDKGAAAALLPQAAWLSLATPVAVYQAQANPDPIFGDRLLTR